MAEKMQLYKCNICGNVIEVIIEGAGELVCCGKPMELLQENTQDASTEKHVPIIEGNEIIIGSLPHPMEENHYINFIEAVSQDKKYIKRKYLSPGEKPIMQLNYDFSNDSFTARELCNIHGLWKSEKNN